MDQLLGCPGTLLATSEISAEGICTSPLQDVIRGSNSGARSCLRGFEALNVYTTDTMV